MSESDRAAGDAAEGALELATSTGPDDPGHTSSTNVAKDGRRVSTTSERQIKVERAQKCLENAALVSKRIKEHRRATAELLGKAFEDEDICDVSSDRASISTRTSYSVSTSDAGPPISVEDALNIPGISESLANTLKQKEILMERIKQYKERSKRERPAVKSSKPTVSSRLPTSVEEETTLTKKSTEKSEPVQLQSTIKEKDMAMSIMQVKMRAMETTILDLQEKISEKDSLIEAKTRATTLMSDNLSKKEKDSVHLLEDTRQQMVKMQENFVAMETEWKEEKKRLLGDIELKNERINHLEQANSVLENARFEISLAHSKLTEDIELKNQLISALEMKLTNVSQEHQKTKEIEEEKGSQEISNMVEMSKRLELLEQLNCQIRQTNFELENKLAALSPETKSTERSASKKSSPQVTRKRGKSASRTTSGKLKSPWTTLSEGSSQDAADKGPSKSDTAKEDNSKIEIIIQSLNKDILDKEFVISQKDSIIQKQLEIISEREKELKLLSSNIPVTEEGGVMSGTLPQAIISEAQNKAVEVPKSSEEESFLTTEQLLSQLNVAREQISALNLEVESANKNMVKVKSAHKLKLKQMQKTIDNFSKMSDSNAEVSKLSEEVNQLNQKIAELEEDKGNLQLHLVDYDSGRLSESDSQRKLIELEALSEAQLKAISDLETQKFDLVQELHVLQQKHSEMEDKLADLQQLHNEHVCTEIKSVQLEEQLDQASASKKELELVIENLKLDEEHSKEYIKNMQEKVSELSNKLEGYIQENIDLTDRLEKLSAEKVSSAESIEMVESLTTQEKLELEEYNKKMQFTDEQSAKSSHEKNSAEEVEKAEFNENLVKLSQESAELNKKIELFTLERHEVMEKMADLKLENEDLSRKIEEICLQKNHLQSQVELMLEQKEQSCKLNAELLAQIEQLKVGQLEVLCENSHLHKPSLSEEASVESESTSKDVLDNAGETISQDDKPQASKTKPAKQFTKEILKLKNIIKEREAEIADCQMKILSLEEQHQKQAELLKNNIVNENTIKTLMDDNNNLKEELAALKLQTEDTSALQMYSHDIETLKTTNEALQNALSSAQSEYLTLISTRDLRINELETLLIEYERKIAAYNDSLQQKDKDMTEYLNQITQLNNVSQKLKSTIEVLEEEKLKDQNGELIKNLNIQIIGFQNLISEQESKIKIYEEEKNKLMLIKSDLNEKNMSLENEIKQLYNSLLEKETRMKELQILQSKHDEELTKITNQYKERDEEIHEIKLQLRKESIENENLRKSISELEISKDHYTQKAESINVGYDEINKKNIELSQNYIGLETKNKELMDKLKKFAANLKKKTNICADFESQVSELHKEIEQKRNEIETLYSKVNETASLQNQVSSLNAEIECIRSEGLCVEQNKIQELETQVTLLLQEKSSLIAQHSHLETNYKVAKEEVQALISNNTSLTDELQDQHKQVLQCKSNIEMLTNKLAEYDFNQKNNLNMNAKISELESEVNQRQVQISNLLNEIEKIQEEFNTFKCAHNAKIQERDLFIENLESEISNYRARISRLEESISVMEDKRYSLERKADQLGGQLEEKQKAYSVYSSNEDELVNRLAVLMDHDQVVEKQLKEIEKENTELQNKIQKLIDDNQNLHFNLLSSQEECSLLKDYSNKAHQGELDSAQNRIDQLESQIKKMSSENQAMTKKQQEDMNYLETEFNLQVENNIKEKKALAEKYEKAMDHNNLIETQLQQYSENIKTLTSEVEEMNKINQRLEEKGLQYEGTNKQYYTEQYINEINNLQAIINQNNVDIEAFHKLQMESKNTATSLEVKLVELKEDILNKEKDIESLKKQLEESKSEIDMSRKTINDLNYLVAEMKKKVNVENVHISEISHRVDSKHTQHPIRLFDIDLLESQIVAEGEEPQPDSRSEKMIRAFEHDIHKTNQEVSEKVTSPQLVDQDVILPKKAYLCYDDLSVAPVEQLKLCSEAETDPFNSEEGWGLGETSIESGESRNYSNMMADIIELSSDKEKLQAEITSANTKLSKALKKLKELKLNNERLMNELKTANQISQFNLLDTTIEDELKIQVKHLEEKIVAITGDLMKERREKENLAKQNDLFNNANERFMEIKEKLENEVEMWKYKFKDATDKCSSFEWGEPQVARSPKPSQEKPHHEDDASKLKETGLMDQIEKENDELNALVDQLTKQNSQQSTLQSKQKDEILSLNNDLLSLKSELKKQQDDFDVESVKLKSIITNLESDVASLVGKSQESTICEKCAEYERDLIDLKQQLEALNIENYSLKSKMIQLQINIEAVTMERNNYTERNNHLNDEILTLQESLRSMNEQLVIKNTSSTSDVHYTQEEERCKLLEETCQTLKINLEVSLSQISNLQAELSASAEKIVLYEKQSADFETKTSKLNDENDQLLSTVTELRTSISSAVDQRGYEVAEMWKQHLAQRESDFANIEHELREQIVAMENKYEHLLDNVQSSSQEETSKMIMMEQLSSLQTKLKDKEDHLLSLQAKYSDLLSEMEILRAEIEDEKLIHENKLLNQQEENENQLAELQDQYKIATVQKDCTITELNLELDKHKEIIKSLQLELEESVHTSGTLKNNISDLVNQIRLKDSEIYQKTQEYNIMFKQRNDEFENLRQQLVEYESKIEELSFEKESELAVLRLKVHEKSTNFEKDQSKLQSENVELTQSLTLKIEECTKLNKQLKDLNESLEEYSARMSEMKLALETQEMEIVTLKDEIDNMQILLESSAAKVAKHVTFASDTKPAAADEEKGAVEIDALDSVPRTELDLALYMLHQRDMRCEELTMELTSLLDERDTLQLRLSNSLRSCEVLRGKCETAGLEVSVPTEVQESFGQEASSAATPAPSTGQTGSPSEPETLQTKLWELRSVRQSRDVRLRQDSERRELDMQLLQRDVARLPPAAAEQLRQAHYTLTRDSQSASTVLLNWLRGKSTPKVVHM